MPRRCDKVHEALLCVEGGIIKHRFKQAVQCLAQLGTSLYTRLHKVIAVHGKVLH